MALTKVTGQVVNSTTDLTVGVLTATTVSIAGTLTYEDVTNVDSVGLITARNGIQVSGGGINVSSGIITATSLSINGIDIGRGLAAVATNTVVGNTALDANTSGANNTAIGQALSSN